MECDAFDSNLILAAEEFPDEKFSQYHTFSDYENRIIRKLIAHGPVLLRGGRGSGKSALMKEAFFRVNSRPLSDKIFGVYISLRYLPLLRTQGKDYEEYFGKILIEKVRETLSSSEYSHLVFESEPDVGHLQQSLFKLSKQLNKRVVLFFDDAAHLGRETSLKEFFDIFRTLSSNLIACKASIYPGVTEFGSRFDLLNDANLIDIVRNDESPSFHLFFKELIKLRYPNFTSKKLTKSFTLEEFSKFLGRSVTGNVRAFVYAMNRIVEEAEYQTIGLLDLEKTLKYLASEYYWPLLEELQPKLGSYEPLIGPTREVAEWLFQIVSETIDKPNYGPSCLIHKEHVERLKKLFEILEYAGFIVKVDSSRAMKSGGRGTRYDVNLCNLFEIIPNNRLTTDLFQKWLKTEKEFVQIHRKGVLEAIVLPEITDLKDLEILGMPIEILKKSKVYPYGLTDFRCDALKEEGYHTVGELAEAEDHQLLAVYKVGTEWLLRIKSVVGQAVWM